MNEEIFERVRCGLEHCKDRGNSVDKCIRGCPFYRTGSCLDRLISESIDLIDNQQERIRNYQQSLEHAEQIRKSQANIIKGMDRGVSYWTVDDDGYFVCSACGQAYFSGADVVSEAKGMLDNGQVYRYCPYCGAEMVPSDEVKEGKEDNV